MKFTTLLKSIFLVLTGFIIGASFEWSRFDWNKFKQFDFISSESTDKIRTPIQQADSLKPTAILNNQILELSLPQITVQLIQNQQVDPAIKLLTQMDLESEDNALVKQYLFEHLTNLRNLENWSRLNDWLLKLISVGFNDSYLYRLQSDLLINNKEYEAALEALHIALQNAPSLTVEDQINKQIDQLTTRLTDDYLSGKTSIRYLEMLIILENAREKRPDHPLISMKLAKIYASQNQLRRALDTLEILPYESNFDASLEALKIQLTAKLNQEIIQKTGIPLIKQGAQYIVKVSINDQVTLHLLLDTGASYTALSTEAIERIHSETKGIYYQNKLTWVNTANGRIQSRIYITETLAVGNFILREANILEANFDKNARVDGLLGMDFLSHFQFKLDYDHDMLYLTSDY